METAAPFWSLIGDVVPAALGPLEQSSWTVTARLKAATAIARQLRCVYQLLIAEREGPAGLGSEGRMLIGDVLASPLGDAVLRAPADQVLRLLADHLVEYDAFSRRLSSKNWKPLPRLYGYASDEWAPTHDVATARRVGVRLAVCVTCDAMFAPYARGLFDAIDLRHANLRVDLQSLCAAIWSWANTDYPALAYALTVARTDPVGNTMEFPFFTVLFRRLLSRHVESALDTEDQVDVVTDMAVELSRTVMTGIEAACVPGKTASRHLFAPVIGVLADAHPDWLPDERELEAEEEFARGAAPLIFEAVVGRRAGREVSHSLDALSRAMNDVRLGAPRA